MAEEQLTPRGTGPSSSNSNSFFRDFERDVQSVYAELLIPVVGNGNGMMGLRKLDLDLSSRYDKYNDFGSTTNPKFSFGWGLTDGFTIRGNVGRSFTAPALTSRGDANGITAESSFNQQNSGNATTGTVTVPSTYPGITALQALNLPGCTTGSATCILGNNAVTGIQVAGGNKDLQPEKGKTYSFGFDFAPVALPGLRLSATYWSAKYEGAITAPQAGFVISSPTLGAQALTIYPTGATAAQIAAATAGLQQTTALPTNTYFIVSFQQRNAFNLDAAGVDFDVHYAFTTGLGDFNVGASVSRKLKMDQQFGSDGVAFSVLNTVGINTTFPSNKMSGNASIGWKRGGWNTSVDVNYTGSYLNWNNNASVGSQWAVIRQNGLYPIGGGQPIGANTTVDFHAGYDFKGAGMTRDLTVTLDGSNIFDKEPPFFNASAGYDTFNASPIGRLLTLGVNKKW
jgi:iron complex outermembrane receptor protein